MVVYEIKKFSKENSKVFGKLVWSKERKAILSNEAFRMAELFSDYETWLSVLNKGDYYPMDCKNHRDKR